MPSKYRHHTVCASDTYPLILNFRRYCSSGSIRCLTANWNGVTPYLQRIRTLLKKTTCQDISEMGKWELAIECQFKNTSTWWGEHKIECTLGRNSWKSTLGRAWVKRTNILSQNKMHPKMSSTLSIGNLIYLRCTHTVASVLSEFIKFWRLDTRYLTRRMWTKKKKMNRIYAPKLHPTPVPIDKGRKNTFLLRLQPG